MTVSFRNSKHIDRVVLTVLYKNIQSSNDGMVKCNIKIDSTLVKCTVVYYFNNRNTVFKLVSKTMDRETGQC